LKQFACLPGCNQLSRLILKNLQPRYPPDHRSGQELFAVQKYDYVAAFYQDFLCLGLMGNAVYMSGICYILRTGNRSKWNFGVGDKIHLRIGCRSSFPSRNVGTLQKSCFYFFSFNFNRSVLKDMLCGILLSIIAYAKTGPVLIIFLPLFLDLFHNASFYHKMSFLKVPVFWQHCLLYRNIL